MAAPLKRTNLSAGAPALTGDSNTDGYAFMKYLATEFGWDIPFDNGTDKLVIRNKGTAHYFRVRSNSSDHGGDTRRLALDGFRSMSDVDSGTGPFGGHNGYIIKSSQTSSAERAWIAYGDDRTMTIAVDHRDANRWGTYYIGDIGRWFSDDIYACLLMTGNSTTTAGTARAAGFNAYGSDAWYKLAATYDGLTPNPNTNIANQPIQDGDSFSAFRMDRGSASLVGSAQKLTVPMLVLDTSQNRYRGEMRGWGLAMHNINTLTSHGDQIQLTTNHGLRTFEVIKTQSQFTGTNNRGVVLIDLGDWDDYGL